MPSIAIPQTQDQQEFDEKYITAHEIMESVGICRTSLKHARDTGKLPEPIVLAKGQLLVWKRNDVSQYLEAWKTIVKTRRQGA